MIEEGDGLLYGVFCVVFALEKDERLNKEQCKMLQSTFCHTPGIGLQYEQKLWNSGICEWNDISTIKRGILSKDKHKRLCETVEQSFIQLENKNPSYFERLLPPSQLWRLFYDFRLSTAFLDIETTGLSWESNYITTIALYDGTSTTFYINGYNLEQFRHDIAKYDVIVTFNGKCFDVPFIKYGLGISIEQVHIDLRYILKTFGLTGGLKRCEKDLGIDRADLSEIDGSLAIALWYDYQNTGNEKALETLLAYNMQDVVNLEALLITVHNCFVERMSFGKIYTLTAPESPAIPYKADPHTIGKLKASLKR